MRQIRLLVAVVAVLTAIIAALLFINPSVGTDTVLYCLLGAACLAVVAPFDAPEPPARKRVVAACTAHLLSIICAFAQTVGTSGDRAPIGALIGLASAGIVLVAWSFATRNRRRREHWHEYFDR